MATAKKNEQKNEQAEAPVALKKIVVTKPFRFAPEGHTVVNYDEGEHEVQAHVADHAIAQKHAQLAK